MSDPIPLLRALLADGWRRLLTAAGDPDERDEDAVAYLDASRWLDAAAHAPPPARPMPGVADLDALAPAPSRDELAARLVAVERELTDARATLADRDATLAATGIAVAALAFGAPVDLTGVSALVADVLPRLRPVDPRPAPGEASAVDLARLLPHVIACVNAAGEVAEVTSQRFDDTPLSGPMLGYAAALYDLADAIDPGARRRARAAEGQG